HGLKVVDKLAELDREADSGLNLTYEVRDGIISHCGENFIQEIIPYSGTAKILENIRDKKDAMMPCTLEGCIVRMVDKIAYAGRDIEDALVAELIDEEIIPSGIISTLGKNNGEIVGNLLIDLIEYNKQNPDRIGLSKEKHEALNELIGFNYKNIYKHTKVEKFKKQATRAIEELFYKLLDDLDKTERLCKEVHNLPEVTVYKILKQFILKIGYKQSDSNALIVLDFIAGMTDNYVVNCLDEIFVPKHIT
ncbi:MAG: hypothetical protein Q7U54_11325, partial [Bacteroidales bacterium]|nr:hypothetical protein [Bacteroidales bacterium]